MRYQCFCHRDTYHDIKKDEAQAMLRTPKRFEITDFAKYYNIPHERLRVFMKNRGMRLSSVERNQLRNAEQKEVNSVNRTHRRSISSYDVSDWPKSLVCALGNVPYEVIDGKRAYDAEAYKRTVGILQRQITNYFSYPEEQDISDLTKSDLVAMRYYRRISRERMAKLLNISKQDVLEMENTSPVPVSTVKLYKNTLNIKNSHIAQLRKVMKGELKTVEDDRTIPTRVKVAVYGRDGGACRHCGNEKNLHYHHIEPRAAGGQNKVSNLILLCAKCHAEVHKGEKAYYMLKKMAKDN